MRWFTVRAFSILEYVCGEWEDSADTIAGQRAHRRVDARVDALPDSDRLPDAPRAARSVTASSPAEGLIARADLVETGGSSVVPVEYKRGAAPDPLLAPSGGWPADRVQVGA